MLVRPTYNAGKKEGKARTLWAWDGNITRVLHFTGSQQFFLPSEVNQYKNLQNLGKTLISHLEYPHFFSAGFAFEGLLQPCEQMGFSSFLATCFGFLTLTLRYL